ncbi:trehalase-like domain-containing protein [Actinosynnema sp. NPDC047251]|uniref:trehalase-like domain-containing protein n=1 Tax=Saccharothrix espanaensis TaxID=103731 RepID=UPI0011DD1397|nr:trehalase-like domain-containing protein [Saccharothrix espanaensis]
MGASEPMVLRSPGMNWQTTFDSRQETATAVVRPREGVVILLELHCGATNLSEPTPGGPERRARAHRSNWTATLKLPTVEPELMLRSALTLTGPAHHDTGTIMAATAFPPRNRAASANGTTSTAGCATPRRTPRLTPRSTSNANIRAER